MYKKLMLLLCIFLSLNLVSAAEWDNVKSYNSATETVTITNALGFGQKLAEIKLVDNTYQCLTTCSATIKVDLKTSYDNPFKDLKFKKYYEGKFIDTNIKESKILIKTKESYQIDVADYGTCQRNVKDNKTALIVKESYSCVVGYHKETKYREVWKEYKGESLDAGVYYFRIEGKKGIYESIEWLPTFLGKEINEWAWWNANWAYRKKITITNPNSVALKEYPVNITIDTSDNAKFQTDGDDIRIVDNSTGIEVKWTNTTVFELAATKIWFRSNVSASSSAIYYVYHGNPTAPDVRVTESDIRGMLEDSNTKVLLHLDEGTGNFAKDETGNNNATHTDGGSLRWQPNGKFGKALNNTGVTTYTAQINHSSELNPSTGDYTFEFWIRYNATTDQYIFRKAGTGYFYGAVWSSTPPAGRFRFTEGEGGSTAYSSNSWNATGWHHVAIVRDYGATNYIYVDGMLNGSIADSSTDNSPLSNLTFFGDVGVGSYFSGDLDEVRFSDKARTLTEIRHDALYYKTSISVGSEEAYSGGVVIELSLPKNNYETYSPVTTFEANSTATFATLLNITLYIWHPAGNLFVSNFTEINGTSNTTSWMITGFAPGSNYKWGVKVFGENTSLGKIYNSTSANRTLSITAKIENESYNADVYETAREKFRINITIPAGSTLYDANLIYNGTKHEGTITSLGGANYSAVSTIDIPAINTSKTIKNFYWQFIYPLNGGNFTYQNSTKRTQNVNGIKFILCNSVYKNKTLNFTAYEEENLTKIENFTFHGTFNYWLGMGTEYENISVSMVNNSAAFCISPANQTYYSDSIIQYEKLSYVKRSYYLTNKSLTSVPEDIYLYLLKSTSSTSFIIFVKNKNLIGLNEVYVYIQRYYPGTGSYKTVEMAKTDENGKTIGHFETETEDYRIILQRFGSVIYTSETKKIFCEETPCTLEFVIEEAVSDPFARFEDLPNLQYNLSYNRNTEIFTYAYVDTSGTAQHGRLFVYKSQLGKTDTTICNNYDYTAAATITCNVSGQSGTMMAKAYISRSPEVLVNFLSRTLAALKAIFGLEGMLFAFFIILVFGLVGLWNPAVGVVLIVFSVIAISLLGIASFTYTTIVALIILAGVILWELKT